MIWIQFLFFFSSRRRHTRWPPDWSSDVCSSDLLVITGRLINRTCKFSLFRKILAHDPVVKSRLVWSQFIKYLLGGFYLGKFTDLLPILMIQFKIQPVPTYQHRTDDLLDFVGKEFGFISYPPHIHRKIKSQIISIQPFSFYSFLFLSCVKIFKYVR